MSSRLQTRDQTRGQRIAAWLRLSAFVISVALIGVFWIAQRAHAYGERVLQHLGDHMMRYAGANHQSVPQELTVNGASFYLSTGTVDASVNEVLDAFHAKCLQKNGQLHEQWASVAKKRHVKLGKYSSLLDGVFRGGGDNAGMVACAEAAEGPLPPEVLAARIKDVLQTGELTKLGNLRYAYVTRGRPQTMFVALWSEGPLNFREMFPKQGDAPGSDPIGVPRPLGSQRVLSAVPKGHDTALTMYSSAQLHAQDLVSFYAQSLPKTGFKLLTKQQRFMVAHDGKQMVTISLQDDASTGHSLTTVATQPD
jgi:hypothetical protein